MTDVPIFTDEVDINGMRAAGQLAARVLEMIEPHVKAGITTNELNDICHEYIIRNGAIPAPLNYTARGHLPPFPKSICTSINDVICHGIPSDKQLKKGDCLNIDVTVIVDGYHGDTSKMFLVGECKPHVKRLCRLAQECLYKAIAVVKAGAKFDDLGIVIETHAKDNHCSTVREFCGHGIGKQFHMEPQVLHYGSGRTDVMQEGQCFTIEPMINLGTHEVRIKSDQWTAVTADRRLSAQWEHTVIVTKDGCEVLTLREEEK